MAKESLYSNNRLWIPTPVFKETFNDEFSVRKKPVDIGASCVFSQGKLVGDGSTNLYLNYSHILNGTYTVRIKYTPTDFSQNMMLLDARQDWWTGTILSQITTGSLVTTNWTKYVNGIASSSIVAGIENDVVISGITLLASKLMLLNLQTPSSIYSLLGTCDLIEIYPGTLTANQVANLYNNSYSRWEPIIQDLDNPKKQFPLIKGTGTYSLNQLNFSGNEQVINGSFDVDSDWTTLRIPGILNGSVHIQNSNNETAGLWQENILTVNKFYRLEFDIIESTSGGLRIGTSPSVGSTDINASVSTIGHHSYDFVAINNSISFGKAITNSTVDIKIDNVTIVEIPSLSHIDNGYNYLKCDTAGTYPIVSNQAYGTWEFDVYKGADANSLGISFIDNNITSGLSAGEYKLTLTNTESVNLDAPLVTALFATANSYIAINTWYRIKIERLESNGVFKDIPTLQTSNLGNNVTQPYTSFSNASITGFSATSDGSSLMKAGTLNKLSITSGKSYKIEFDLTLNSGTAPTLVLASSLYGAGTFISNTVNSVDGKNSIILTATGSATGSLWFYNNLTTSDYTISNLRISEIYTAGTFATFIKGGSFGDDYVLVDTTGGSWINPKTNNTYTTSNFIVIDADAGDRIGNIRLKKGID